MPAVKKYTLAKLEGSEGGPPVCAFFLSDAGCRNGANCKFSHGAASPFPTSRAPAPMAAVSDGMSSSVVSSESSSDESFEKPVVVKSPKVKKPKVQKQKVQKEATTPQDQKKKKRKSEKKAGDLNPFTKKTRNDELHTRNGTRVTAEATVKPVARPSATSMDYQGVTSNPGQSIHNATERQRWEERNGAANLPKISTPVVRYVPEPVVRSHPAPVYAAPVYAAPVSKGPFASMADDYDDYGAPPSPQAAPSYPHSAPSFRNLGLPVAPFSVPTTNPTTTPTTTPNKPRTPKSKAPPTPQTLPLPQNAPGGLPYLPLVLKTREDPRFMKDYDFPKLKSVEYALGRKPSEHWFKTKPFGPWCGNNPQVIAIDCEMCETKDPETERKDHKALCRVSVVNALNPSEVLLDTLVKPDWPVSDHRSSINGIKKEHLKDVEFRLCHAQAFMKSLCSEETVIVGHALNNDLGALKMEHYCVVDSSYLFKAQGEAEHVTCGLRDCCSFLLKKEMPETHDSVNDAIKSFELVEFYRQNGGKVPEVVRPDDPRKKDAMCLFLHRIPETVNEGHLVSMFLEHTDIRPEDVPQIEFSGGKGKTTVRFSSAKHAALAFDTLSGDAEEDVSGRLQKRIYLRDRSHIKVRKMIKKKTSLYTR